MHSNNPVDTNVFDIVTLTPADPSAGANFAVNVNANSRWQPLSIDFLLATDANAANRHITVHGYDGTNVISLTAASTAQTASLNYQYHFNLGIGAAYTGGSASLLIAPLNSQLFLQVDESMRITINNIQVGDQISNVFLRTKQWIVEN